MHILHLSDLHFGTSDDAQLWYSQLAEDLHQELNCTRLDALILSGDIANKSTPEEYDAARQFLYDLCLEFQLKPQQIVIVPGNHDLNWKPLSEAAYTPVRRSDYSGQINEYTVIDQGGNYLEVKDPEKYNQRFLYFRNFYQSIVRKPYPLNPDEQYTLHAFPDHNLLILGLNSAWQLDHYYRTRAAINDNALSNAINKIRRNPDYTNYLKIAVWHHPLNSPDEDRIKNHGFMERLAVNGFRLALHGHVHIAKNELFRYDQTHKGRKIDIICAGTFGASTRELVPGHPWQYNLLKLQDNQLIVETRCRPNATGTWKPYANWTQGAGQDPLPRYTIELEPASTTQPPIPQTNIESTPAPPNSEAAESEHIVIFMITGSGSQYQPLEEAVRRVFERPPYFFEVRLASDYTYKPNLLENIREHMKRAQGFVAEISELNPSIMFELGAVVFSDNSRPIFPLRSQDATAEVIASFSNQLHVTYGSLTDPLKKLEADIRSAFERDGRIVHEGIRTLLAQRKKRFLSRRLLEGLRARLEQNEISRLLKQYTTVEDLIAASPVDVARSSNSHEYIISAVQGELKNSY